MPSSPADLPLRLADHAAFLRAVARRLVRDADTADDLVQETFVRALQRPPTGVASLRAWLATVVRNVFRDRRAAELARARRERTGPNGDLPGRARGASAAGVGGDDPFGVEQLSRALQALPPESRRVLQARYYAGQSPGEIAAELGVPVATVKTRLQRALQALRADLTARLGDEARWRRALLPLASAAAPAPALPVAWAWGITMANKHLVGAAVLVVLSCGAWLALERSRAAATELDPGAATRAQAARVHTAVAAPPQERVAASPGGAPEVALAREAVPRTADTIVAGRVVYGDGTGVPFASVLLRHGGRRAELCTNRDGGFVAPGTWPADAELGVEGARRAGPAAARATPTSARGMGAVARGERAADALAALPPVGSSIAMSPPPSGGRGARAADGGPVWQTLADLGARSAGGLRAVAPGDEGTTAQPLEVVVDLPPTWFVRLRGDAPLDLVCGLTLETREPGDGTWWHAFAGLAPLQRVPGVHGELWCRLAPGQVTDATRLVVASEDGLWWGGAALPGHLAGRAQVDLTAPGSNARSGLPDVAAAGSNAGSAADDVAAAGSIAGSGPSAVAGARSNAGSGAGDVAAAGAVAGSRADDVASPRLAAGSGLVDVGAPGRAAVIGPVDVELHARGAARGVVRDRFGAPCAGVAVVALGTERGVPMRAGDCTDAAGSFRIGCLPPGEIGLRVVGENVEPNDARVDVALGRTTERDLVVTTRVPGGAITGSITTSSGAAFRSCAVWLTSRGDDSIWRTATIEWRADAGRQRGHFTFRDVPLVECDVTFLTHVPCTVATKQHRATAPADGLVFHVDDAGPTRPVRFVLRGDAAARGAGPWDVWLAGDAGWRTRLVPAPDGEAVAELPIGQTVAWQLCGPALRAQRGRVLVTAAGEAEVAMPAVAGCSLRLVVMQVANFFPAVGVTVLADGVPAGTTDAEGGLTIDLPAAPRTLTLDPAAWRIFRDQAHRPDVDPLTGAWVYDGENGQLGIYAERVR